MELHLTLGVRWLSTDCLEDTAPQTDAAAPEVTDTQSTIPKPLAADRLEALLQMQKMDSFCKCISK